jgi:DNA primase
MTLTTGTTELADLLEQLGVEVTRAGEREILGRCPVHLRTVGKWDAHPSWSMNASNGLWICFSCGAKGTLGQLVSELTGDPDSITAVHNLVISAGLRSLSMPKVAVDTAPEVDWLTFSRFSPVPDEELARRGLSRESARIYGLRWDSERNAWIIPIVDQSGELLGWQEKGNEFTRNYPVGIKKSNTLFGIDKFNSGAAILVESPLDVVRFDSAFTGMQGLATFGAHVSKTQIQLLSEVASSLIVAMDNDGAGIASADKLFHNLPSFRHGIRWLSYAHTTAKDIGEMTNDELQIAVDNASVIPWWIG